MDVTTIFAGVVLLLAIALLFSVIKIVPQGREFTVERFGKYTKTLSPGIGFLTPFKVRQMASTMDEYKFSDGDEVVSGEIDRDRTYTEADFNTKLVIDQREKSRVHEFMDQIDQRQKTLVFCATQDHAARVRNFINQIKDNLDPHYCERVTADDGELAEKLQRTGDDAAAVCRDGDSVHDVFLSTCFG